MERISHKSLTIRCIAAAATFIAVIITLLFTPTSLSYPAPFRIIRLAEIVDAILTAALFYSAIGLLIKRRASWVAAVCTLISSAIWSSVQSSEPVSWISFVILIALGIVIPTYRYYPHQNGPSGVGLAFRRALKFTALTTLISCLGGFIVSLFTRHQFGLIPNILATLDHMYVLANVIEPMARPSAGPILIRILLFLIGATNYLLIAFALLRPILNDFIMTASIRKEVLQTLRQYGTSSEDYFKYFPADKSYFFAPGIDGFVAYEVSNGICVALADPIAKGQRDRTRLLKRFLTFANGNDWQVCVLPVQDAHLSLYKQFGLTPLKLGANAIVDTAEFVNTTASNKHFRYVNNRFTRLGYTAELLPPPHSPEIMRRLNAISDQWLTRGNRKERGFAMGRFDNSYLQSCELYVVRDKNSRIQAFVNLVPAFSNKRVSFDLLRYCQDSLPDTNAFLFMRLIEHLGARHYTEFDMGLAPLSGLEASESAHERGLHLLYKYANHYFAFKGLYRFKNRFNPTWEPRYAVFQGAHLRIVSMAVELNRLMKYTPKTDSEQR